MVAPVKFGDSDSYISRDIQQRSRRVRQFPQFLNVDNCQSEVHSDVMSSVVVDATGEKVPVKFGDSRSNRFSRYTTALLCTNDNDDNDAGVRRSSHKGKTHSAFCLKMYHFLQIA